MEINTLEKSLIYIHEFSKQNTEHRTQHWEAISNMLKKSLLNTHFSMIQKYCVIFSTERQKTHTVSLIFSIKISLKNEQVYSISQKSIRVNLCNSYFHSLFGCFITNYYVLIIDKYYLPLLLSNN